MTQETIAYYNDNAQGFIVDTLDADVGELRSEFVKFLSQGAHILDFGCGSGRDTRYFLERGYHVSAVDASRELCHHAELYTGIGVRCMLFQELQDRELYDGVWACSSLLHLSRRELEDVWGKVFIALKPGGVFYSSYKYGNFEGMRNGRYFLDLDERSLDELLRLFPHYSLIKSWLTADVRPKRGDEKWLNLIVRKN